MTTEPKLKKIPFDVQIPNLDGDGIAQTIRIEVTAYTDPESGEDILTPESLELIERTQARHMGVMSAGEIKELRQRLGLSQEDMSELLQIGGKSYTRWESGRARPSRSMNVVLCALRDGQLDVNYLQALRDPERQSEWAPRDPYRHYLEALMTYGNDQKLPPVPTKSCKADLLSAWKHFAQISNPDVAFITGDVVHLACAKMKSEDEDMETPMAPRLPPEWQQRRIFINYGNNPKQLGETEAG